MAETRQSIALSWTSPSDGGRPVAAYVAKLATSPLTSANFNNTGTVLPTGLPLAPGTAERLVAEKLDAGTAYYLGLAAEHQGDLLREERELLCPRSQRPR